MLPCEAPIHVPSTSASCTKSRVPVASSLGHQQRSLELEVRGETLGHESSTLGLHLHRGGRKPRHKSWPHLHFELELKVGELRGPGAS